MVIFYLTIPSTFIRWHSSVKSCSPQPIPQHHFPPSFLEYYCRLMHFYLFNVLSSITVIFHSDIQIIPVGASLSQSCPFGYDSISLSVFTCFLAQDYSTPSFSNPSFHFPCPKPESAIYPN